MLDLEYLDKICAREVYFVIELLFPQNGQNDRNDNRGVLTRDHRPARRDVSMKNTNFVSSSYKICVGKSIAQSRCKSSGETQMTKKIGSDIDCTRI